MVQSTQYKPRPITDVFTNDTDIDRRTCSRKVPMKVLILGLGRTGTACEHPPIVFILRAWPQFLSVNPMLTARSAL